MSGETSSLPAPRDAALLALRLSPGQDALIREAAAASGESLSAFVISAALSDAEDALADRRRFRLDHSAWSDFAEILDRPAERIPALTELFERSAPWER